MSGDAHHIIPQHTSQKVCHVETARMLQMMKAQSSSNNVLECTRRARHFQELQARQILSKS